MGLEAGETHHLVKSQDYPSDKSNEFSVDGGINLSTSDGFYGGLLSRLGIEDLSKNEEVCMTGSGSRNGYARRAQQRRAKSYNFALLNTCFFAVSH